MNQPVPTSLLPTATELPDSDNPNLQYLFVAEFADGSTISQTPDDQSLLDAAKPAIHDVLEYSKSSALVRFHVTDGNIWYMVDLRDGTFEVNGIPFEAFDPYNNPYVKLEGSLRLIYFPNTDIVQVVDQNSPKKVTGYKHSMRRYFLGWQFTDKKGKNYQQTIAIR